MPPFYFRRMNYGRVVNFMRYLSGLCCFILGLVLSPFAFANWTVESTPVAVSGGSINSSGQVVSMATYKATHPTNGTLYMDRLTTYNKSTTGTLAKRRIASARSNLNPLGLLMTGTLLGVGMFLDSVTGDLYSTPPSTSPYTAPPGYYWQSQDVPSATGSTPHSAATAWINSYGGVPSGYRLVIDYSSAYSFRYASRRISDNAQHTSTNIRLMKSGCVVSGPTSCSGSLPSSYPTSGTTDTSQTQNNAGTQATPEQIHDSIFPTPKWTDAGYLGDHLPELLRDPVTNSPAKTQETANKAKEIENAQNVADDPAYTPTSPETVPEPTTDTPPVSGSFPSFCAYAGIMCDFVNWMRKDDDPPEPPDMPTTDLGAPIVFSSGLGSGSCPQNKNVALTWLDSQTFSYQPLCDVAVGIKPLVIASSGIFALLILGGIRGRGQGAN